MFGTKLKNQVKRGNTRKLWYLLWKYLWLLLKKFYFWNLEGYPILRLSWYILSFQDSNSSAVWKIASLYKMSSTALLVPNWTGKFPKYYVQYYFCSTCNGMFTFSILWSKFESNFLSFRIRKISAFSGIIPVLKYTVERRLAVASRQGPI